MTLINTIDSPEAAEPNIFELGAPTGDCVGSSPLEGLNASLLAFDPMCLTP